MGLVTECVLCGGADFMPYRHGRFGAAIAVCRQCRLVFTQPQPDAPALHAHYDETYYAPWTTPREQRRRQALWQRRLRIVRRVCPAGRLLDVGCGDGTFLHHARLAGYDTVGVEISDYAVRFARAHYGLTVIAGPLEARTCGPAGFDLVTLWHALEHAPRPDLLLREARAALKPDGRLLVAVPNVEDVVAQGAYWIVKGRPYPLYTPDAKEPHLFHFSAETLARLLERTGFTRIRLGVDFAQVAPAWRWIEYVSYGVARLARRPWHMAHLAVARK